MSPFSVTLNWLDVDKTAIVQLRKIVRNYEKRKDPTKTVVDPTRSISVALNLATINTLKAANIDTPCFLIKGT